MVPSYNWSLAEFTMKSCLNVVISYLTFILASGIPDKTVFCDITVVPFNNYVWTIACDIIIVCHNNYLWPPKWMTARDNFLFPYLLRLGADENSLHGHPQRPCQTTAQLCLFHVQPHVSGCRQWKRWSGLALHQTAGLHRSRCGQTPGAGNHVHMDDTELWIKQDFVRFQ